MTCRSRQTSSPTAAPRSSSGTQERSEVQFFFFFLVNSVCGVAASDVGSGVSSSPVCFSQSDVCEAGWAAHPAATSAISIQPPLKPHMVSLSQHGNRASLCPRSLTPPRSEAQTKPAVTWAHAGGENYCFFCLINFSQLYISSWKIAAWSRAEWVLIHHFHTFSSRQTASGGHCMRPQHLAVADREK